MRVLSATKLEKRYNGVPAVSDMHLEIRRGECFGLLGPNGAGKTTTLRMLLGLTDPDGGEITVLGEPVPARARIARSRIGVVPQMDNLDPDFTVRENLVAYGRYFGLAAAGINARIPELLEFAGLAAKADAKIATLSGGMKRRLTLARALVNDPELIVLDEPTTGLDPQARHVIWQGLRGLVARGRTVLLTTHFMEEAERLCDRLLIMDRGRTIAEGSPRELIARHIEPFVTEIYGDGMESWRHDTAARLCARVETAGETLFCYSELGEPVTGALKEHPTLRYLHRPSNLEDVFLKLTGRDLRDQ